MSIPKPLICSFYTPGGYYEECAHDFTETAESLGLDHHVEAITLPQGSTWPDICRAKIPFLHRLRQQHPNQMLFWVDVDCKLLSMPAFVANSTADIIGFQRGFGIPLTIGYALRTRFWEPCFLGIGTSQAANNFLSAAYEAERSSSLKATDDFFF